jgi:hypothetical protein
MHSRFRPRFLSLEDRCTPTTLSVTNLNDDGPGSLRQAILSAENETANPGADTIVFSGAAVGGTVNLLSFDNRAAGTADDTQPVGPTAFILTTPVTLLGTGETITRATGSANFRLFQVTAAGTLTIQNLTLSNGMAQGGAALNGGGAAGLAGAIYNQGTLVVQGCTLTGNQAIGGGNAGVGTNGGGGLGGPGDAGNNGGAPNGGAFGGGGTGGSGGFGGGGGSGNSGGAGGFGGGGGFGTGLNGGGGGFGGGGGNGNISSGGIGGQGGFGGGFGGAGFDPLRGGGGAGMGGAVFNQGGSVTIVNSTIAGNTARGADSIGAGTGGGSGLGGGVFSLNGSLTLTNATIAGNTVIRGHGGFQDGDASGGAVYVVGLNVGTVTPTQNVAISLDNSILANSTGGADLVFGIGDGIPLIQTNGGRTIVTTSIPATPAILPSSIDIVADAKLGALQNNGGFTPTMALLAGSTAIDTGSNAAVAPGAGGRDQRGGGFVRIFGGTVDIGAVEIQPTPAVRGLSAGGPLDGTGLPISSQTGQLQAGTVQTFFAGATVNVRTATVDVTGDGVADYVGGTGPGSATRFVVLDGVTGKVVADVSPFEATFTGGVFIAGGDVDGDGKADVVVTPDQGGGPIAAVYSGAKLTAGMTGDAAQITRFFGIEDAAFRGGARPAMGDLTGDGVADLVVSAGFLGGPRVAVFGGPSIAAGAPTHLVGDFFAFENTLRNGAFVAVGDVNRDGIGEIAFGGGPGGGPRVRLFDGAKLLTAPAFANLDAIADIAQLANYFAGDSALRGGVRLTLADANGDGMNDLLAGSGTDEPSQVRVFLAANLLTNPSPAADQFFDPFGATLENGVFVG